MDKKEELLNTIMGCSLCGYYTCNRRDYVRHLETKKCKMRHAKENAKVDSSEIKELAVCPIALDDYKKEKANQVSKEVPLIKQKEQIIKDEVSISSLTTYEDSSDDEEYEEDEIYENIYTSPVKFVNGWQSLTHLVFAFVGFIRDFLFQST